MSLGDQIEEVVELHQPSLNKAQRAEKAVEMLKLVGIPSPEKRVKDDNACPNLGDILIFITLSSKFKIKDALNFYVDEQLDRQVYWMI